MILESKRVQNCNYQRPGQFEETRFEKIHNVVLKNSTKGSLIVAKEISSLIRKKQASNETCVLGLATGSSPIKVYEELVRMHKEEGLCFSNVITFNLDEYYPMNKENTQSYHYFMHEHLFNHINISRENIHIPDGEIKAEDIQSYCLDFEEKIKQSGGIDFQLLGIGRTGHIGFNEPGAHFNSITRIVNLDHLTRGDASKAFMGIENVPKKAITLGISTVFAAKRVVLLGWGENKAGVIKDAIEGMMSSVIPATYLQEHYNTTFVLDEEAASELTRNKTPWLVGVPKWTNNLKCKAVVWLCGVTNKAILSLTEEDYNKNGLSELIVYGGSVHNINIDVFNKLQHTITGWPGGKPNEDDCNRPERANPTKKRVLIFSPHPDDDVISMGGTFERLLEQGHEVHVAYQTSGNIAVSNEEAIKFAEILYAYGADMSELILNKLLTKNKNPFGPKVVRELKGLIRRGESYAAIRKIGLNDKNVHFLDLPFYETGAVKKKPISKIDIDLMTNIISVIKPHMIFAAGDLADPHGTHKVCLDALFRSLDKLKRKAFMKDCWVWLYRGAWHEWNIHEIEMAVPLSPNQVLKKRKAIFCHQSQKDGAMFQGEDSREFWLRAEERNRETAKKYKALGLAGYAAMEAFVKYNY